MDEDRGQAPFRGRRRRPTIDRTRRPSASREGRSRSSEPPRRRISPVGPARSRRSDRVAARHARDRGGQAIDGSTQPPPTAGRRRRRSRTPIDFVRFCYRRRRVGWPELYDEMCAVAGRGLFRGYWADDLAGHRRRLQRCSRCRPWPRSRIGSSPRTRHAADRSSLAIRPSTPAGRARPRRRDAPPIRDASTPMPSDRPGRCPPRRAPDEPPSPTAGTELLAAYRRKRRTPA